MLAAAASCQLVVRDQQKLKAEVNSKPSQECADAAARTQVTVAGHPVGSGPVFSKFCSVEPQRAAAADGNIVHERQKRQKLQQLFNFLKKMLLGNEGYLALSYHGRQDR